MTPRSSSSPGFRRGKSGDAESALSNTYGAQYSFTSNGGNLIATMKPSAVSQLKANTLQQAIEVIRERVNKLGVSEPLVEEYNTGSDQILVELPGIDDPTRVKDVIQSTARLEIPPGHRRPVHGAKMRRASRWAARFRSPV